MKILSKQKVLKEKPRLKNQLQKRLAIKQFATQIKTTLAVLLKVTSQINDNGNNINNNIESLRRHEIAMSIIKTNNKIYKPKTYDKAINNQIHGRQWRKIIKEKL